MRNRAVVLGATPRVRIETPSLQGSINLKGARIDDLVLVAQRETIAKDSPPVRLLSPAGAPGAYFASFGWSGQGVAGARRRRVWTASATVLSPGQAGDAELDQPHRPALRADHLGRRRLSVHRPAARRRTPAANAIAVRALRPGQPRRPSRPTLDSWTVHVGPIGVFGGKANYDVNWKTLDETGQASSYSDQPRRLARLHRQILADRAGSGRNAPISPRASARRRAAPTRPIMPSAP